MRLLEEYILSKGGPGREVIMQNSEPDMLNSVRWNVLEIPVVRLLILMAMTAPVG